MPSAHAFRMTNAANATAEDVTADEGSDSQCLLLVDKPVHTHKARKSTPPNKPRKSRSRSAASRSSGSMCSGPKSSGQKKTLKRRRSRSSSSAPGAKIKRNSSKPRKKVSKVKGPCACPFRARGLGRVQNSVKRKSLPEKTAKKPKKTTKKSKPIAKKPKPAAKIAKPVVRKSKPIAKKPKPTGGKCPFAAVRPKRATKTSKPVVKTPRKRTSAGKKAKKNAVCKCPGSSSASKKTIRKRKASTKPKTIAPKRTRPALPSGSKSLRKSPNFTKKSSTTSGHCLNKTRPVSALWKSRLRPRPLKSARFSCYRPSCLEKSIQKPSNPKSVIKNSKPKVRKTPKKSQKAVQPTCVKPVWKNRHNAFQLPHVNDTNTELWCDATECHDFLDQPQSMSYTVEQNEDQPVDMPLRPEFSLPVDADEHTVSTKRSG